jgi:acyl CoA:acetate/3-ketoacid CoA transferase beta subunit
VIGAGQIDAQGRINSTRIGGKLIVGSGGANDIASAAQEVLVTVRHGATRLVPRVDYVTSPGRAVRTIVTTKAVLARACASEPFAIVALLGVPTGSVADAVADVRAGCGFALDAAADVAFEPPPTPDELAALRMFDPARTFLGRRPGPAAPAQA